MKVLLLHFASESRDAKAARLARSGAEVLVDEPRWPRFYELARREKPAAIVIDFSRAPTHALETADYLSKAKETRDLELFAIHVFDERKDFLVERVPKVKVMSERELSTYVGQNLERWEVERTRAEEAAREQRRAAQAAGRARSRPKAAASPAAPPPAAKPKPEPAAAASKRRPEPPKKPASKKPAAGKKAVRTKPKPKLRSKSKPKPRPKAKSKAKSKAKPSGKRPTTKKKKTK